MPLLRRFLAGLLMALVALLPGTTHAFSATLPSGSVIAHRHVVAMGAHAHGAAADCAGHDREGSPAHHCPCGARSMACCMPAIIGMAAPSANAAIIFSELERALPSADRDYRDAPRFALLRPPARL